MALSPFPDVAALEPGWLDVTMTLLGLDSQGILQRQAWNSLMRCGNPRERGRHALQLSVDEQG
jgi:hypothetical protein